MFKINLEKFESTNTNLRTKTVLGQTDELPEVNHTFVMMAESLTPGGTFRYIETSLVKEIVSQDDKVIRFKTENSTYQINIVDEQI